MLVRRSARALVAAILSVALGGCPVGEVTETGKAPSGENSGNNGGNGGGTPTDTNVAQGYFYNYLTPAGPVATGLDFLHYGSLPKISSVCSIIGTAAEGASIPTPCPNCDYAYSIVVQRSQAEGPYCDTLGMRDGDMDGYEAGWGFATMYEYYYPGVGFLLFEDALMYYFPAGYGSGWYPVTFRYDGYYWGGYPFERSNEVEAWTALAYYLYFEP